MKIVFLGSPQCAVDPLKFLIEKGYSVVACVSQPARPAGRGKALQDPPVARFAKENGVETIQPASVNEPEVLDYLRNLNFDIALTAAYGQILSKNFLAIPRRATINIHPSLLPRYRGATPVPSALLDGLTETGVTVLFTVYKMDAGNIIVQKRTSVQPEETADVLTDRLFSEGARILPEAFKLLADPGFQGAIQDEASVTHCRKLTKESGLVQWRLSAEQIFNQYRAYYPWPGSYTFCQGRRVVVSQLSRCLQSSSKGEPGTFFLDKNSRRLLVQTSDGTLELCRLKPEGGKEISGFDYWNGLKAVDGWGKFSDQP
ncbi:MAG: methionyl-tRNA formyltransferase [Oligoflexales bacterium]